MILEERVVSALGGLFTHLSTCGMTMVFSKTCTEKYSPYFLAGSSMLCYHSVRDAKSLI